MVERRRLLLAAAGSAGALLAGLVGAPLWRYLRAERRPPAREARPAAGETVVGREV